MKVGIERTLEWFEKAAALGDDPNFATTIANNIAAKVAKVTSTDNAVVRFNGTTGEVQNSAITIDDVGNLLLTSGTGGLGYGTGSGGTVTQLISKSTAVLLNKPNGLIIMNNAALAAGVSISFTLFNNLVSINDNLLVTIPYPLDVYYTVRVGLTDGTPRIILTNVSGYSLSEAVPINFAVIKGANS